MYLTKVLLNPQQRPVMDIIANPQKLHGMIESCFDGPRERRLWRLDAFQAGYALYIQAARKGEYSALSRQLHALSVQTASMDAFLAHLHPGQNWHFRIRANPTHQVSQPGKRGRLYPHLTLDAQKEWLLQHIDKWGISVTETGFDVMENRWMQFRKHGKNKPVQILAVTYEGVLRIKNADALRTYLETGIGRGKAYGCGLMTLAKQ